MQYTKNIAFTKLIRADGRLREFNFRRKHSANNPIYDIDVSNERGIRLYFSMHKIDGLWTIREPETPGWISEVSLRFHEAIEEQENLI
jgi:hypothetical protein